MKNLLKLLEFQYSILPTSVVPYRIRKSKYRHGNYYHWLVTTNEAVFFLKRFGIYFALTKSRVLERVDL